MELRHEVFAFNHVDCGQRCGNADWVATKSRGMRSRNPIHDLGFAHRDAQRHARSDALRHANDVRLHARVFDGPPLSGTASSALHFVRDQQNSMTIANAAKFPHEDIGRNYVSAFTLHWLDENRRYFFRRKRCLEQLVFDEARTAQCETPQRFALRDADKHLDKVTCVTPGTGGPKRRFCCGFEPVSESAPMVRP